jgi:tetratricopeptide (TPR) repeat protein
VISAGVRVRDRDVRRSPLPARLPPAERDFCEELRLLVDAAGLSSRALEDATSSISSGAGDPHFYSRSQWDRWLNGESLPPRKAVRILVERLTKEEIEADHLADLWARAFAPSPSPHELGRILARPRQLPISTRHFIGRSAELEMLTGLVDQVAESDDAAVIVIEGTAGVGKTTLASQLGHQVCDQFPDGQLYVNMRGFGADGAPVQPVTASEALRGFLDAFGVSPKSVPVSVGDQAALYRSLVAGKRVLVVVDNARDAAEVRRLLPGSPGCLTLVTSRNQLTGLVGEGTHVLRLDAFTPDEGRDLLARRVGAGRVATEPQAADELTGLCAGLPLALSIAAAHAAAHPEFPLAVFSSEFRSRGLLDTGDPATTTQTIFSWSYHHLSDRAARMFRLLGIHPGADVGLPAAASLAAVSADAAREALDELTRAHLVEEHLPGRFTFHDLLRGYAAEQARALDSDEDLAAAERRLLDHYLRTAHGGMRQLYPGRHHIELPPPVRGVTPETFVAYEQVLDWFQAEHEVLLAAVAFAGSRGLDVHCWQLAWTIGSNLNRRGLLHDFAVSQRIGLDAARRLNDPESLGHILYELAHACSRLGEVEEADGHLRESLEVFTRLGDRVSIAEAQHGLAALLDQQGRYKEALTHARESLRLRRSFGDRATVAYSENAVGWICAQLGHYTEALRHCRRAVELHRESGSRSGAADALDSIGFACRGLGDHEQAIRHYQQALAIYREIGDPAGQATTLTSLGDVQLAADQPGAARRSWRQALAAASDVPSADTKPIEARLAQLG